MTIAESIARVALEVGAIKINVQQPFTWASVYKMPFYNENRLIL
jgi:orotate phosphoribosyltransferase